MRISNCNDSEAQTPNEYDTERLESSEGRSKK